MILPSLNFVQAFLAVLSGFVVGFSLGLIGGGGSILAVPLLLYVVGYSKYPHLVIGTTALAVGLNAYVNLYSHYRNKTLRVKPGIVFALFGALGAFIGAELGLITPGNTLLFLFGILMILVAVMMLRGRDNIKKDIQNPTAIIKQTANRTLKTALTGIAVGIASGYFGIGGGFLIVPGLMFSSGLAITEAISTSLISVGTFGIVSAFRYAISNQVDYIVSLLYLSGGVFGGILGARLEYRAPRQMLRLIFSAIVIIVAIYIIFKNLPSL
ncbi:MAG: sulfite exporter TauE/SafE family protein [Nitrososphaerota archaeon]